MDGGACSALRIHCGVGVGVGEAVGSQGCEEAFVGPTMPSTRIVTVFLDGPSS